MNASLDASVRAEAHTTPANCAAAELWTVLCVDDEANILSALKRVLRAAGYCVVTVTDGPQALLRLAEMPIDIVISDMRMPGMDGAALLEQVQLRWPAVARLLLTGHADMGATVAAINRGRIMRYLHKPWDEADLLGAVAEATHRIALERERARLEALTEQLAGAAIPKGSRILAVADAFDDLQHGALVDAELNATEALALMRDGRGTQFDPEVLDVFLRITEPQAPHRPTDLSVNAAALQADMVLSRDLVAPSGPLMLGAGPRLTPSLTRRIHEFEQRTGALTIHIQPSGRA